MRSKAKLIVPLALVVAVAVAGLSLAAGGGSGKGSDSSTSAKAPTAFVANGERNRRDGGFRGEFRADADVRAVLADIREAVADQAAEIAGPVIDKAESDDEITAAQADALRKAAQDIADGKRPSLRDIGRDRDVHEVVHDAFAAAAEKAPGIAEPIIDKAVEDKKITEAQADQIRDMLKRHPAGRGFGKGRHHGPGFGGGPPAPFGDADVRAVLEDVHEAVAKQASDIAGPVIDKAEQDGKITEAQADQLRKAAADFVGRKPRGGPPSGLNLRDSDVRDVLHDVFAAVAAKTPGIAKPIVDKAMDDGKITEAQARTLNRFLARAPRGPHGKGPGPGHGPPGMGGGGPQGFAPGGPPPDSPSGAPEAPAAPSTAS